MDQPEKGNTGGIFTISEASPPSYYRPDDAPPSYDSIFNKIQKTKDEPKGVDDLMKNEAETCCSITFALIVGCILGVMISLPISMIVIGAVNLNNCPVQPYIPIYLVVSGSFVLLQTLIVICFFTRKENEEECESHCTFWSCSLIGIFLLVWFVVGSVWVYSKHDIWSSDYKSPNYCNPTLYLYTFGIITVSYMIMGLSLLYAGYRVCCACFVPSSEDTK